MGAAEDEERAELSVVEETVQLGIMEVRRCWTCGTGACRVEKHAGGARENDAPEWQIRVAVMLERWSRNLVDAVRNGKPTYPLEHSSAAD